MGNFKNFFSRSEIKCIEEMGNFKNFFSRSEIKCIEEMGNFKNFFSRSEIKCIEEMGNFKWLQWSCTVLKSFFHTSLCETNGYYY